MKTENLPFPLIKLPAKIEMCLYLIKEELKSYKVFNALEDAGLHDCSFQPTLEIPILRSLGMDDGSDETLEIYLRIIQKRSKKIDADNDSLMKQTIKVYRELLNEKERHSPKKKQA